MSSFPEFKRKVEGFYRQIGAGYLFSKDFQDKYLVNGTKCLIYVADWVHSESQVKRDIEALYGALKAASQRTLV